MTQYQFGPKRAAHMFCNTCGVSMFNYIQNPEMPLLPVNARTINGVDVTEMQDDRREIVVSNKDGKFSIALKDPEVEVV